MNQPLRFQQVEDDGPFEAPPAAAPQGSPRLQSVATEMLLMGIGALSKRFVVALSRLFMLLTMGSVFALWYLTPDPNTNQIISLSIYAAVVLAANYLNIRRGN